MINMCVEIEGIIFTFSMPAGCPIGSAYDAAFKVLNEILSMANEAVVKQQKVEIVTDELPQ